MKTTHSGMTPMRFVVLLLLFIAGCAEKPQAKSAFVPVAEIDPALVKVAEASLPGVKFENARKFQFEGEDAFEIRGKRPNGKICEVEVTSAGRVVEVEQ